MEIDIAPQTIQAIGWLYALTSALRVVAYAPQVALIRRCPDGGRSVSLVTWVASTVSHVAAAVYGVAVVADPCVTAIAVGNTAGSLAIVWAAMVRRDAGRGAVASLAAIASVRAMAVWAAITPVRFAMSLRAALGGRHQA